MHSKRSLLRSAETYCIRLGRYSYRSRRGPLLKPLYKTAAPFWRQTTQIPSRLSPKRDCGTEKGKNRGTAGEPLGFHLTLLHYFGGGCILPCRPWMAFSINHCRFHVPGVCSRAGLRVGGGGGAGGRELLQPRGASSGKKTAGETPLSYEQRAQIGSLSRHLTRPK